jgi:hypothetical protein
MVITYSVYCTSNMVTDSKLRMLLFPLLVLLSGRTVCSASIVTVIQQPTGEKISNRNIMLIAFNSEVLFVVLNGSSVID